MKNRTVRICSVLTAVMLFAYVGCLLLELLLGALFTTTVPLPAGVLLCLSVLLPGVVLLIYGIRRAKQKKGVFDLIFSIATLLVSLGWLLLSLLYWVLSFAQDLIIEIYLRSDMVTPLGWLLSLFSYFSIAYTVIITLVACYLLVVFVISVIRSKQKWLQLKAELHKPAAAVLILVPSLFTFARLLLTTFLVNSLGIDVYATVLRILTGVSGGASILLALGFAAFILIFGLIIKKQPECSVNEQPAPKTDVLADMDLPAGVSADDLNS